MIEKKFNAQYISKFLMPSRENSDNHKQKERNYKLNTNQNPILKSVELSTMNTNSIKTSAPKTLKVHNLNTPDKISKQINLYKMSSSNNLIRPNNSAIKPSRILDNLNTVNHNNSSKKIISIPLKKTSRKNLEVDTTKNSSKSKLKPTKSIKSINVLKKNVNTPSSNIENLSNFYKRTQSSKQQQYASNDSLHFKDLKKNKSASDKEFIASKKMDLSNQIVHLEKYNENFNPEKKKEIINLERNMENFFIQKENNLNHLGEQDMKMLNKEKINKNSKSQETVLIRNKYKNIVQKFC